MSDETLSATLANVEAFVRRFVVLDDDQAVAVALWTAHTHAVESATVTPYLSITSAEKRSGKTRLLEVLTLLVAMPWFTARTTAALLLRKVDDIAPTLLLDESDAAFNGDKDYAEALRGVLNSGHRRGGVTSVCVGQGAKITYRDFSTFCPKAIAGIGDLPDTVGDRSIPIRLKRRSATEQVDRFRERKVRPTGRILAEDLEGALDFLLDDLRDSEPQLPDELDDRAQDSWEPLLAIADAAGSDWPVRARRAARHLSGATEADDESVSIRLLAAVRAAFEERGTERIASHDLLESLQAQDDEPWADWRQGRPITARRVAELLRRFGIRPRKVRIGEAVAKGYRLEDCTDSFGRYLPTRPSKGNTGNNRSSKPKADASIGEQEAQLFPIVNGEKPHGSAVVPRVLPEAPVQGEAAKADRRVGLLGVELDDDGEAQR